jgi:hypothetical protein
MTKNVVIFYQVKIMLLNFNPLIDPLKTGMSAFVEPAQSFNNQLRSPMTMMYESLFALINLYPHINC